MFNLRDEPVQFFGSFRRHFPFPFYDFYLHIVRNEVIKKRKKNNHGRNVFSGDDDDALDTDSIEKNDVFSTTTGRCFCPK